MPLDSGTRLGPYEIVAPIGAGGMGEVYRARDTRLDRSVAVKILPAEMAHNAQLRTRFEREAKTISQLNHPNICTLHDVGENFLVMELLDGESLAERIARGPLPMDQVLRYGVEIARALDRAHRHGITHRDLKPGNVMLTKAGAKVLDFGLAKSSGEIGFDADAPTMAQQPLTAEGTIVGTFQYMAPEQLEGQAADHRTDIFALGAVLYEMATGKRAFDGKTRTSVIAAIVAAEPKPIHELQPVTPPSFEHIVGRCLAKDPDARWQSAHDVAEELAWIARSAGERVPVRRSSRPWMIATIVATVALVTALAAVALSRRTTESPRMTLALAMPYGMFEHYSQAALSPDGATVALIGWRNGGKEAVLSLRRIDESVPRTLPGTEGAQQPFWSPDGKSIGFFAGGKLKRISIAGGPPQVICDAATPFGATWGTRDVILFSGSYGDPIYRVDASGGKPVQLTKLSPREEAHRWPVFLPDGEHFVFLADAPRTEDHNIRLGSLEGGNTTVLTQAVGNVTYAEPSTLLFVRAGSLMAQPLDLERKALVGEPRVLAENLVQNAPNHRYEFTVSTEGRLLYRATNPNSRLTWVDRSGRTLESVGEARRLDNVRIAPDRKRIAFGTTDADGRGEDIWLLDPARNVSTRLTFDAASEGVPVWSPDGTQFAFMSMRESYGNTYVAQVSNPSQIRRITNTPQATTFPTDWSPDGTRLLIDYGKPAETDIYVHSLESGKLVPHVATPFEEFGAVFSPDGSRIAYVSSESGTPEVYVESFPSREGRRQISNGGGFVPRWRADGKELFYVTYVDLRVADLTREDSLPQTLFRTTAPTYEVSADGERFLMVTPVEPAGNPLTFVSNWRQEK